MAKQLYPTPTMIPTTNPYLQRSGMSTYIQGSSATDPRYTNYRAPMSSSSTQVNAYGLPLSAGSVLGATKVKTNPYTGQFIPPPTNTSDNGGGGNSGDNSGGNNNETPQPSGPSLEDLARRAEAERIERLTRERDSMLGRLGSARDASINYLRDARAALGRKRDEFKSMYDDTAQDIFNTSESGRGQLQATAEGAGARLTNRLLSQGIQGSALDYFKNQQEAAKLAQLGDLIKRREASDSANLRNYQGQQNWAMGQDEAIGRGEQEANSTYQQGVNTTLDNFQGTLEGLLTQALQQSAARQMQRDAITATTGQRFAPINFNDSTVSALNSNLANTLSTTPLGLQKASTDQINPLLENLSLTDEDLRRKGLLR